jgi:CheY-like chemotaxis protein
MSKPVVLVIEDSEPSRILYTEELGYAGYEVVAARTGQEGLERLQEQPVDVVVLDIAMPGMDGVEALGKILNHDKQLPIILNTAYSSYKDDFMTWAAEAYVVKSSDLTELLAEVAKALKSRGIEPPPPPPAAEA